MFANILSEEQRALLPFIRLLKKEFYLVGGTAISLQIGHRQSIDFDLFKKSNIQREKLAQMLKENGWPYQLLFANAESFHIVVNGVKITFFQFPFDIPATIAFEDVRMPDLLHLAAMKAYALGRRAKWKDYLDLYFILRDHLSLDAIVGKASELFSGLFSQKLLVQQLCYFEDVDYSEEVSFMPGHAVSDAEVQRFLTLLASEQI